MTSIKEALEQASAMLVCLSRRYKISENHKIRFTGKWSHMGEISLGEVLDNANTALASLESGDARERIARIIDPGSFYIRDESNGLMCTVECNGALAAATALEEARAEIERLRASVTRLTANPADHRYWEGRWRDADRELSTLRARVREVVGPFAAVVLPWGDIGSGMIDANSVRAARQLMEDLK